LDSETRELRRRAKPVHISPRAFQLLELLLQERPRAISKEEILKRLWPDTHVTDGTLTTVLAEVRSAIGDDAHRPDFVRTVHRFGCAFSGSAEEEQQRSADSRLRPSYAWRLLWETREIGLHEGENILGRDPDAAILIDHGSVSRRHARISVSGSRATLEDLGSKNGTYQQGVKLRKPGSQSDRDEHRFGSVRMDARLV